ncbi:MAG: hypothetical protein Salg2KO_10300 [Salibacteraceae bacterium]
MWCVYKTQSLSIKETYIGIKKCKQGETTPEILKSIAKIPYACKKRISQQPDSTTEILYIRDNKKEVYALRKKERERIHYPCIRIIPKEITISFK